MQTVEGQKRKVLYGKTRAEVAEKLTRAMADRDGGLASDTGNLALGGYLERWLEVSVKGNVRPRTLDNYRMHVRRHIAPALGHIKLKTLSPAHVQCFYRAKLDAGLASSTVRYMHAVLHRALKQALRWGLVPRNVVEAVDPPKVEQEEAKALSPAEVKTLLLEARGDRLEALYVLAVHTGLRQGELLGLRWDDVDFKTGKLRVSRQLQNMRDGSGLVFAPLKTGKGRRTIRLTNAASVALKRHRRRQAEEKLGAGTFYGDRGLIFATGKGTPLNASNVHSRSFKPLLKRAGLPDRRFHDLRHTCATLMLSQGVNPKIAQEVLGHANVAQTMDTYSHVLPDMQEPAVAAMERALLRT
ncbi:MAG: site-specific integrase [Actinomycetota bacterium]|nr:site-specific integrase [Actinomycetota bacterium]